MEVATTHMRPVMPPRGGRMSDDSPRALVRHQRCSEDDREPACASALPSVGCV